MKSWRPIFAVVFCGEQNDAAKGQVYLLLLARQSKEQSYRFSDARSNVIFHYQFYEKAHWEHVALALVYSATLPVDTIWNFKTNITRSASPAPRLTIPQTPTLTTRGRSRPAHVLSQVSWLYILSIGLVARMKKWKYSYLAIGSNVLVYVCLILTSSAAQSLQPPIFSSEILSKIWVNTYISE